MLLRVLELDGDIEKVFIGSIACLWFYSWWRRYLHSRPLHGIPRQNLMLSQVRALKAVMKNARAPRSASGVLQRKRARDLASGSGSGPTTTILRTVIRRKSVRAARRKNTRGTVMTVTMMLMNQRRRNASTDQRKLMTRTPTQIRKNRRILVEKRSGRESQGNATARHRKVRKEEGQRTRMNDLALN